MKRHLIVASLAVAGFFAVAAAPAEAGGRGWGYGHPNRLHVAPPYWYLQPQYGYGRGYGYGHRGHYGRHGHYGRRHAYGHWRHGRGW